MSKDVTPSPPDSAGEGEAAAAGSDELELTPELLAELEELAAKVEASVKADAESATEPEPVVLTEAELLAERTDDLQRLQAEYANFKKRVDRDRSLARQAGIEAVVRSLLPVLDSVEAARGHDELVGGFKLVAEELEKVSAKYGLETYGEVGDIFDPQIHEALMQTPAPAGEEPVEPTITMVMQKGVTLDGKVLRPARVGVANPQ